MRKIYALILFFISFLSLAQNPTDIDTSFNPFSLPNNHFFVQEAPKKSEVLSDGKILILDYFYRIIKLDGNVLDTSFNIGTGVNFSSTYKKINDFVVQPDGKILIAGNFTTYNGQSKKNVLRLNPDGNIDPSFTSSDTFVDQGVLKIDLEPDGKILLIGDETYSTPLRNLIRLNSDGSYDSSFSVPAGYRFECMAVQPDGKIIVNAGTVNPVDKISRLNTNGSFDSSFTTATFTVISGSVYIPKLLIQNDGKILAGGHFNTCNGNSYSDIVRLDSNGAVDMGFSIGTGFFNDETYRRVNDISQQSDGKLMVAGDFLQFNNIVVPSIIRLNTNGSIDSTFSNGSSFLNFREITSVSLFSDQKIFVSGSIGDYRKQASFIAKINSDGTRDLSINNYVKGFYFPNVRVVKETSDGKIWVGGDFHMYNNTKCYSLTRLNHDGTIDTSLNYGGSSGFESGTNDIAYVTAIAPLPNGQAYIAGRLRNFNGVLGPEYTVIKINANGTRDTSFNLYYSFVVTSGLLGVNCLLPLPDGRLLVAGNIASYNSNSTSGVLAFSSAGTTLYTSGTSLGPSAYGADMALQTDGKILISYGVRILRENSDLTGDSSFVMDPALLSTSGTTNIKTIQLQPDGKIIIQGTFVINGVTCSIVRLLSNGSLDTSFNFPLQNSDLNVHNFILLPDQKVMIATTKPSTSEYKLLRLNTDGTVDSSFTEQTLYCQLSPSADGKFYLRSFRNYQGQEIWGLTRLMGDNYYFFQGQNRLDLDNNGCYNSDTVFPYLKINIAGTTDSFDFFTNPSGSYSIGTIAGNYTITPTFENPSYFTASPTSISASFPSQVSPVMQNFCISPNGIHNDLEVTLLPLNVARPGVDVTYKIIYKNKGNQLQTGTVNLAFEDAVLDLVISSPAVTNQSLNNLSWNFTNLEPFETRQIVFTLNVNSPIETPAVTGGDELSYTATISSAISDEIPSDNSFPLSQIVVNSFDPNDKTCLEGSTITTTKVGDYVHYLIRFENTGTYAAQNIKVRDVIDVSKYDINTLVPISGSHLFTTKIFEGNIVDFYFENINLPFADDTNDGYVAFKIKTKSTLVAGDSFSNSAAIYFDYNSAINTNTATTTVQGPLAIGDFIDSKDIVLYPNPVSDILHLDKKDAIEMSSISIYNTLGQLVLIIPNAKDTETVNVSPLKTGNYIIKINSDKGILNTKFIKK